jgi:exodeoxyribonuclease VIII
MGGVRMRTEQYTPQLQIEAPMLVLGMPADKYHGFTTGNCVSKSGLDKINRSPAHFKYAAPREQSRAMVIGSALHCALLEPDKFAAEYLLLRDVKVRTASEYKEAVKSWGDADYVLTGPESDTIIGMQQSLYADANVRRILTAPGHREASLFVQDPVTSVGVRCRYDILTKDGYIFDLKKTRDARPAAFVRSINEYRYHVQAALYSDAYEWAFGEPVKGFVNIAIEPELPHAVKVYRPDADAMAEGRRLYREDLKTYAECVKASHWPAYTTEPEFIGLPAWVLNQIEAESDIQTEGDAA